MKKGVNIHISFTNRAIYTFITLAVFLVLGVTVFAFGTFSPSTFGHSAGELDLSGGIEGDVVFRGNVDVIGNIKSTGFCIGNDCITNWSDLGGGSALVLGSCKAIFDAGYSTGNKVYTINPGSGEMQVYCDMTTEGGGWTLVVSISLNNNNHNLVGAVDVNGNGYVDHSYLGEKLSDATINLIYTDRIWVEIPSGSGDIHCEKSKQTGEYSQWSVDLTPKCGYTYSNTESYGPTSETRGPTVWINYDYRGYTNSYFNRGANADTSAAGGHPPLDGYLWIR